MRRLHFQQLHIPIQRACKLPLWTVRFIILIIHLIKAATIFQQITYLQLSLPVRACSSLVRLFLWQDLYGLSTNAALSPKCYVPHVCARLAGWRSCFHMLLTYSAECFGYFPTSLMGKKKKSGEVRDFIAVILSPLCPLRHITHNPHITNSRDSSYSRHV